MSGTHITNTKLDNKTNLHKSILKATALGVSLVCLLGISACTSSNISPSLIAKPTFEEALTSASLAATQQNEQATGDLSLLSAQNDQSNTDSKTTQAPAHQTSLIAEAAQNNKPLNAAPLDGSSLNDSDNGTKIIGFVPSPSPRQQPNNQNQDANQIENLANAQIAAPTAAAPNANQGDLQTASISKEQSSKKLNFFERLLKSRRDKVAAKKRSTQKSTLDAKVLKLAKARKMAELNNGNQSNVDTSVKEGVKLFSIEEESGHEDNTNVEVASVGALGRTAGPHGLVLQTQGVQVACLRPKLLTVLNQVKRHFGKKVMVTSGYRSPARNRRAGGVKNSHHTTCNAADIQLAGISKWDLAKYLRTIKDRGGVGTYCRTKSVHIDIGTQRDWHQPCRRRKRRK